MKIKKVSDTERDLIYRLYQYNREQFDSARWKLIYPLFPHLPESTQRDVATRARRKMAQGKALADAEPTTNVQEKENYLNVRSEAAHDVRTLEDLLRYAPVDMAVWKPINFRLKTWPTSYINRATGEAESIRNFQVNASFIRRVPEPVEPVIQPVELSVPLRKVSRSRETSCQSAVIISDLHVGFLRDFHTGKLDTMHDRQALDVALQIAHAVQPDLIVFLGDVLDLPDWSDKFIRSPEFYWLTQPAVMEAAWWFAQFRQVCPAARIVVLQGNHDLRMNKAIVAHLPAAYNLRPADEMLLPPPLSIPRMLALHQMDIEYLDDYPNNEIWINPNLIAIHGMIARQGIQDTVKAVVQASDVSVIHGHIHRTESAARTIYGQEGARVIRAYSPGCLCRIDGVVPGTKKKQNWQQGLGVVAYDEQIEDVNIIPVQNGRALYERSTVAARDRQAEIQEDLAWEWPD